MQCPQEESRSKSNLKPAVPLFQLSKFQVVAVATTIPDADGFPEGSSSDDPICMSAAIAVQMLVSDSIVARDSNDGYPDESKVAEQGMGSTDGIGCTLQGPLFFQRC